ncbi:MAG: DUF1622 domain-containing protein [Microbacteriaceae bacterium]|nr:DUF1622 domain-containing protein [Microbacteriaceae bacterium]
MMAAFFEWSVLFLEILGVAAILIGFTLSLIVAGKRLRATRDGGEAFTVLRRMLASSILLGLEILVAADLVRTVTSVPSFEDAMILGLIVIIRTVLSLSIQIEIDGVVPWKRAMLTSGAQLLHESARGSQPTR